jgi:hypothetical protein
MSFRAELILVFLLPSFSLAGPAECVKKLYEYGRGFDPTRFSKEATKKTREEPNPNGAPGEMLHWTTLSLKGSWVTTLECNSCSPHKGVTDLFLTANRKLPCGLTNGMSEQAVTQRLGRPYERKDGNLLYVYPPFEQNQEIMLRMRGGKLAAIHWGFYMD